MSTYCGVNACCLNSVLNVKALIGAFSVIVKTGCGTDGALHSTRKYCREQGRRSAAAAPAAHHVGPRHHAGGAAHREIPLDVQARPQHVMHLTYLYRSSFIINGK